VFAQSILFSGVARDKVRVRTILTATEAHDDLPFVLDVSATVGSGPGVSR
jgi:hypothetical protein